MTAHQNISQLANQCVMCGLCIPHCPTYHLFKTENESPRGRIALFKALEEGQLDFSENLLVSLDHCLGCRACEKVCPSQVNYAGINNLGRQLIASKSKKYPLNQPWMQTFSEKLLVTQALHPFVKLSAKAIKPLQQLLGKKVQQSSIGTISNEIKSVTDLSYYSNKNHSVTHFSSSEPQSGQVILFKGCSGDLFEQQTLDDTVQLLNACHINVITPKVQQCCGAIKLRHGDKKGMASQVKQNIKHFTPLLADCSAILSINNSCSGQLKEYSTLTNLSGVNETDVKTIAQKSKDIISFLYQTLSTTNIQFAPLDQEVAVHIPCSLKNVLREEQLLLKLLALIPGIKLKKLDDQYCCGAAGSYMFQYPEVANHLVNDKIDNLFRQNAKIVVSSNIGCTLHFKLALNKRVSKPGQKTKQQFEFIHPVRLLARQLIK